MNYAFENVKITADIKTGTVFQVPKMEDYYLGVFFRYTRISWNGCIPLQAKYEGIAIPTTVPDVKAWVLKCYKDLDPANNAQWQNDQRQFWERKQAYDTQAVFEALNGSDSTTKWLCRKCGPVPRVNPQSGARIRELRILGYYVATCKKMCPTCGKSTYFDLLVRLPRNSAQNQKRFTISKSLEQRIKEVLPQKDACFDSPQRPSELIIDHKFPSSRWVNGETINETSMPDDDIQKKFQYSGHTLQLSLFLSRNALNSSLQRLRSYQQQPTQPSSSALEVPLH